MRVTPACGGDKRQLVRDYICITVQPAARKGEIKAWGEKMSNKRSCCVGAASQSWKTRSSGRNPACGHKKIVIELRVV